MGKSKKKKQKCFDWVGFVVDEYKSALKILIKKIGKLQGNECTK